MNATRKKYEGQIADGKFVLLEYLGGSGHSAVYRTERGALPNPGPERQKAAIKILPVKAGSAESQLNRWRQAEKLSHPNLVKVFESGECKLGEEDFIYVVEEFAEEDLSQILPERALTADETRGMLVPAMDALAYLHAKGFVHAHLSPSNIMAIGDQVKLSCDGIVRAGERMGEVGRLSSYDPPEAASGRLSTAADMWSLGMTLAEVLTQRLPIWERLGQEEPRLPEGMIQPFAEIANRCLVRDARNRWRIENVAERMQHKLVKHVEPPAPKVQRAAAAAAAQSSVARVQETVSNSQPAAPKPIPMVAKAKVPETMPQAASSFTIKKERPAGTNLALGVGAIALLVIAILEAPRLLKHDPHARRPEANVAETSAPAAPASSVASNDVATTGANPPATQPAAQPASPATHPPASAKPQTPRPVPVKSSNAPEAALPASSGVTHQEIPNVPQSSLATITGTVRVAVRVKVDDAGNVSDATFDHEGPSQYFSRIAMKSAREWTFAPSGESEWVLHFQFTNSGTKVQAVPATSSN